MCWRCVGSALQVKDQAFSGRAPCGCPHCLLTCLRMCVCVCVCVCMRPDAAKACVWEADVGPVPQTWKADVFSVAPVPQPAYPAWVPVVSGHSGVVLSGFAFTGQVPPGADNIMPLPHSFDFGAPMPMPPFGPPSTFGAPSKPYATFNSFRTLIHSVFESR